MAAPLAPPAGIPDNLVGATFLVLSAPLDPSVAEWSEDGTSFLVHDEQRWMQRLAEVAQANGIRLRNSEKFDAFRNQLVKEFGFVRQKGTGDKRRSIIFSHPSFLSNDKAGLQRIAQQ